MTRHVLMEKKIIFHDFSYANVHQFDQTSCFFIYISYILGLQGNDNIIQQDHLSSFSLTTVVYIFVTSYFSLRAMQSRQRGYKKIKLVLSFCRSTQGHPLGSFLRSRYKGRHETEKRCVTTLLTAAKETTPYRSGFFRLLAISTNLGLNRESADRLTVVIRHT